MHKYTYQNGQINPDMNALFVCTKKRNCFNELKTKYETKFAERENKVSSLENSCNKISGIKAGN